MFSLSVCIQEFTVTHFSEDQPRGYISSHVAHSVFYSHVHDIFRSRLTAYRRVLFSASSYTLNICPPIFAERNLKVCGGFIASRASELGFAVTSSLSFPAVCARPPCWRVSAGADGSLCCRITATSAVANVSCDDPHLIRAMEMSVRLV